MVSNMKRGLWYLAIVFTPFAIYPARCINALQVMLPRPPLRSFTVTLSTAGDNFKVDASMPVVITVLNTGSIPGGFAVDRPHTEYILFHFSLTMNGNMVPKTSFHRAIRGEAGATDPEVGLGGSADYVTLAPGKSVQYTVDLKKLYAIAPPGTYTFSVELPSDDNNPIPVFSQPIQLKIVPSQQPSK